jgi:hypothetical protein
MNSLNGRRAALRPGQITTVCAAINTPCSALARRWARTLGARSVLDRCPRSGRQPFCQWDLIAGRHPRYPQRKAPSLKRRIGWNGQLIIEQYTLPES